MEKGNRKVKVSTVSEDHKLIEEINETLSWSGTQIKTDYMGNDQLLPAYNVQIGVTDE